MTDDRPIRQPHFERCGGGPRQRQLGKPDLRCCVPPPAVLHPRDERRVFDLVRYYDELWFPGADDLLIADESGKILALLDHEENLHVPSSR